MKKLLSSVLAVTLLFTIVLSSPINTFADNDDSLEAISYEIIDGEAIITHIALSNSSEIPSKIKGFPVTTIDYEACYEMTWGTVVNIPEGVTTIRNAAFAHCKDLSEITLPDSISRIESSAFADTAYYNDESNWKNGGLYIGKHLITAKNIEGTFKVEEGTLTIADNAFLGNSNTTEIILPKSVKNIGKNTFTNCDSLVSITASKDSKYFTTKDGVLFTKDKTELVAAPGSISGTYKVPSGVKTIRQSAFQQCDNLTNVSLPDTIKNIESYAFGWCSNLKSINLPASIEKLGVNILYNTKIVETESNWNNNVLYIGNHLIAAKAEELTGDYTVIEGTKTIAGDAFGTCIRLKSVTLPDSITFIGNSAFSNCEKLNKINLPDSITYIGECAFHGCAKLKSIKIPKKIKTIYTNTFWECRALEKVTLPNGLKKIMSNAFLMCSNLKKIDIPSTVNHLGAYAFGCCSLESVNIPEKIEYIEESCFNYSNFKEIVIPKTVKGIFNNAFFGCKSLEKITIYNKLEFVEKYAFDECEEISTIHYKGTKSQKQKISIADGNYYFKTAVWKYEPLKETSSKKSNSSNKSTASNKAVSSEEASSVNSPASSEESLIATQSDTSSQLNKESKQNSIWVILAIAAVVGIISGVIIWSINKKRKQ